MSSGTIIIIVLGLIVTMAFLVWLSKRQPIAMGDRVEPPPDFIAIIVTYNNKRSPTKWQSQISSNYRDSEIRTQPYKIKIEYKYKDGPSIIQYKYTSKKTLEEELLIAAKP